MKQEKKLLKNCKGFTLLEMLVVVLIIGILAGIALPQYQMAVTKAKVASILPIMRRWKDALMEYKLQHGNYEVEDYESVDASWPSDWHNGNCSENSPACANDYWYDCYVNEGFSGYVYCGHKFNDDDFFYIVMYQSDDPYIEKARGMLTCQPSGDEPINAIKVCKALGGKLLEGVSDWGPVYQL